MKRWSFVVLPLALAVAGTANAQFTARSVSVPDGTTPPSSVPFQPNATLTETFDALQFPPAGWVVRNQSATIGTNPTCWGRSESLVLPPHAGLGQAFANFNCTAGANTISGWLLTPQLTNIANGDTLRFWTRKTPTDTFPDRLEVRLCLDTTADSCGAAGSTGATPTDVGNYTTTILAINPTLITGVYPTVYTEFTVNLSGLPAGPNNGRIAFRYFVTNGGPDGTNSDFIAVDTVSVTPAPNVNPTLTYNPVANTPIALPGGAPGAATASIGITSAGAVGTGNTSVTGCALTGANPGAFTVSTTPANGVFNTGTTSGSINLGCTRGASASSATLTCTETPNGGAGVPQSWPLTCPAADAANVTATKTVAGSFVPGGAIVYTITLANTGTAATGDNAGDEFTDVLPGQLTLVSANATSGTALATVATRTVTWNGALAAGASVTITINATINNTLGTVSNQGTAAFDADGNGTNETTVSTDDPGAAGAANATVFAIGGSLQAIPALDTWSKLLAVLAMLGVGLGFWTMRSRTA